MLKIIRRLNWVFWPAAWIFYLSTPAGFALEQKSEVVAAAQGGAGGGIAAAQVPIAPARIVRPFAVESTDQKAAQVRKIWIGRLELRPKDPRSARPEVFRAPNPVSPLGSTAGASVTFDVHWTER